MELTSTQELQLRVLRAAYKTAKTTAERVQIEEKAAGILHPPNPQELAERTHQEDQLQSVIEETLLTPRLIPFHGYLVQEGMKTGA